MKSLFLVFAIALFTMGCQKELNRTDQVSEGTLQEDGAGNCAPFTIGGTFKESVALNSTNFIEVQVNFIESGSYGMSTDTLNGYSFFASGFVDVPGLQTIRLAASGTPLMDRKDLFTISYNGLNTLSECVVEVTVSAQNPTAIYAVGAIGSTCSHASLSGVFSVGVPLTQANTVLIDIEVTVPGSYVISTTQVNGFSFSRTGVFTMPGLQTISLIATGTPTTAGQSNFSISGTSNSCSFQVNVGGQSQSVFTLSTTGTACASPVVAGTYTVGVPLTGLNTISLNVNVTNVGAYTITTSPVMNGITFSGSGVFTLTGPQVVKLTGTGIPVSSGPVTHTVTVGSTTCTFSVTYANGTPPPIGPAVFSFLGTPGFCTGAIVAGSYIVGTPLNSSNTVTVQVNVTTPGTYMIASPSMFFPNGMQFAKVGTFTTTGIQNVVLPGSGTPVQVGIHQFTSSGQGPGCNFLIKSTTAVAGDFYVARILNENKTFNTQAKATYLIPGSKLLITGLTMNGSPESFSLEIDRSIEGGTVTAMIYTNNITNGYKLSASYIDPTGALWKPSDGSVIVRDQIFLTITSITASRVEGIYSTTVRSNGGNGPNSKSVVDGSFSVPIQ